MKIRVGQYHPFFSEENLEDFSMSGSRIWMWFMIQSCLRNVARRGYLVLFDIKDFFPSVRKYMLEYLDDDVRNAAERCFVGDTLPLGFPTSPTIAFLASRNLFKILSFSPISRNDRTYVSLLSRIVVRYCDNFMMYVPDEKLDPKSIKTFVYAVLKKAGFEPKFVHVIDRSYNDWIEFLGLRFYLSKKEIRFKFPRKFTKMAAYFIHTDKNDEKFQKRKSGYLNYITPIVAGLMLEEMIKFEEKEGKYAQRYDTDSVLQWAEDRESRNLKNILEEHKIIRKRDPFIMNIAGLLNSKQDANILVQQLKENGYRILKVVSALAGRAYHLSKHISKFYTDHRDKYDNIVEIKPYTLVQCKNVIIAEKDRTAVIIRI